MTRHVMSSVILATWLIAGGFATPLPAQPTDADLRDAAEAILSGDEFGHFPHFERSPPVAAETIPSSAAQSRTPENGAAPDPRPWWERLRPQKSTPPPASDSPAPKVSPEATRPQLNTSESNQSIDNAAGAAAPPAQLSPQQVRPQRSALRGSDGVERPVRHVPKAPRPLPKSYEFNWWFADFFAWLGRLLGVTLHGLAYLVLAVIVGVILALVIRALAAAWQFRRGHPGTTGGAVTPLAHDRSPGETAADVFLRQALTLAEHRRYRDAIGLLLLGAMSSIERRDWIRYRRGLTLRDYLRSVRSHPPQHDGLKQVVAVFEPVEYGRVPATHADFEQALSGYRAGFASETTASGE